ncbi:MAG: hypothetical protein EBZ76_11725, partial [Synechococcaceae bacterium WB9_2_170]|nr:hypothetical protein [Synechococcaceae bacterium WB9_2_170]
NLRQRIDLVDAVIAFDHKIDCPVSRLYLDNLRRFCARRNAQLVVSPSSLLMSNQVTATAAFMRGIQAVSSDYVLFFEHDHIFLRDLDWGVVDRAFSSGVKLLRFNEGSNVTREHWRETLVPVDFMGDICQTNYYCNKPFLATTEFCRCLFELAARDIPTWNGLFGGFIEGPVMRQIMADEFNLSPAEFRKRYPIFLYGPMGAPPMIEHFGVFPGRRARWMKRFRQWLGRDD